MDFSSCTSAKQNIYFDGFSNSVTVLKNHAGKRNQQFKVWERQSFHSYSNIFYCIGRIFYILIMEISGLLVSCEINKYRNMVRWSLPSMRELLQHKPFIVSKYSVELSSPVCNGKPQDGSGAEKWAAQALSKTVPVSIFLNGIPRPQSIGACYKKRKIKLISRQWRRRRCHKFMRYSKLQNIRRIIFSSPSWDCSRK